MTPAEFEERVLMWASRQPDIQALVQIGSRAQPAAQVDDWSDWDYHLIVRRPKVFRHVHWPQEIAPCWCAHLDNTERGVSKVTAIFAEGHETDFVVLSGWQMRLVCRAMRYPWLARYYPAVLGNGIRNLRLIAGPGYRVVIGGPAWASRYESILTTWPEKSFCETDFLRCQTAFWRYAVWTMKKIARGEQRAAARWYAREILESVYVLLAEEARLAGKKPRPEARKAEQWLGPERLAQTRIAPGLTAPEQARALLATIDLFQSAASSVAAQRGFPLAPHGELEQWLRRELARLA